MKMLTIFSAEMMKNYVVTISQDRDEARKMAGGDHKSEGAIWSAKLTPSSRESTTKKAYDQCFIAGKFPGEKLNNQIEGLQKACFLPSLAATW